MGVKWVMYWQPLVGTVTSSQNFVDLVRAAESIQSVRIGRWNATCATYRPVIRDAPSSAAEVSAAKELFGASFSELPRKYFFVLRQEFIVVEAATSIQAVMERIQLYLNRLSVSFEGVCFQVGDFLVKIGKAIQSQNEVLRGVMIELEYIPTTSLEQSGPLLSEFLAIWQDLASNMSQPGRLVLVEPQYADFGLSDTYSPQHMALQYVLLCVHFLGSMRTVM
ncbi:hypothetical protein CBR_g11153 [Chara braunii]|uniref:Mediator of RNA polymerase II transcription subunit 20 n=1 Tax=Chara braunii TaxID=69332 RepID=A0A388KQ77_CHABU|nr:hypothetical protein CBR_g11153 [Chara braunii]|eukprot:GBG72221.1 hypothetical protein CBR_g11153 [Chara braunii]